MRAIVLVVLFFVMVMSIVSALSCRRLLPMLTFMVTAIKMMYFGIVDNSSGKDKLLTKICILALTAFIAVLLFFSYNFVYKPDIGQLWWVQSLFVCGTGGFIIGKKILTKNKKQKNSGELTLRCF